MVTDYINQTQLGRLPSLDFRDRNYPIRTLLAPAEASPLRFRYWYAGGWWGNQRQTPQCVAYSWIHAIEDGPVTHNTRPAPFTVPADFYRECQQIDEWEGEDYEGTSVRAGAKILQARGILKEYRWCFNVDEMITWVLNHGPLVMGTNWYSSMFTPLAKSNELVIAGSLEGGHAYLVNGVSLDTQKFRIKNSWGRTWGNEGQAYISFDNMARLLAEWGEACAATEIKLAA